MEVMITLRELRERAGLRQVDLASAVGTSESRVRSWEAGKTAPQVRNIVRLATVLGVSVDVVVDALEGSRRQRERRNRKEEA